MSEPVELQVPLIQHDGWPPVDVELVWAVLLDAGTAHYRLDTVPAFAIGLAWQDIVVARKRGGVLTFLSVARRSGHSTLRVLLDEATDADEMVAALAALGAGVQRTLIDALLTIDIAPETDAKPILAWLDAAEARGEADWEEGWLADSHQPKH